MSKFAKKANTEVDEAKVTKAPAAVAKGGKTAQTPKLVKAAKAAKAPKEKAERAERTPREDGRKITAVVKENPHREGCGRYEAYEAMQGCKTAGDYYATGHKPKYLAVWDEAGLITLKA